MVDRQGLAHRVRQARVRAGLGKEAAARAAGISSITWKRIEDGLRVQDAKLQAALDLLKLEQSEQPPVEPDVTTSHAVHVVEAVEARRKFLAGENLTPREMAIVQGLIEEQELASLLVRMEALARADLLRVSGFVDELLTADAEDWVAEYGPPADLYVEEAARDTTE